MNRGLGAIVFAVMLTWPGIGWTELGTHAQAWQTTTQITLPPVTRSVVLENAVDPQQWLTDNLIRGARVLPQGPQHTLVQFEMDDTAWEEAQASICGAAGVALCDTASCVSIQNSEIAGVDNPAAVRARIVPKDDEELPDQDDPEAGMCRSAVAVPPPADAVAGAGGHLNLELQGLNTEGSTQQAKQAKQAKEKPAQAPVALPFQLNVAQAFSGAVEMGLGDLPADTTDYMLEVSEQCRTAKVPLDSVSPAHIPTLVIIALNAGSTAADVAASYGLTVVQSFTLTSTSEEIAVLAGATDLASTLPALALDVRVASAQREYIYTTAATDYSDAQAGLNYGPRRTGADRLHGVTTGSGQLVAVIDTGVDLEHPELTGRVEGMDFTGTGITPDKHGTAVASIIAAAANNAVGAFGVAPDTKILALKACEPVSSDALRAKCRTSALVKALDAALNKDAQIINMSLAGPPDALVAKVVNQAALQNRVIIAGAGNGGANAKPAFPAALPNVIAVTATDFNNRRYREANVGGYIDIAAPGVDIVTAEPGGERYLLSSGTSWAAAHVSGIAALIKDIAPIYGASELTYALSVHATDLGKPGLDTEFGAGLVDACSAASAATFNKVTCREPQEESNASE